MSNAQRRYSAARSIGVSMAATGGTAAIKSIVMHGDIPRVKGRGQEVETCTDLS